jgi:hypothetical protein
MDTVGQEITTSQILNVYWDTAELSYRYVDSALPPVTVCSRRNQSGVYILLAITGPEPDVWLYEMIITALYKGRLTNAAEPVALDA